MHTKNLIKKKLNLSIALKITLTIPVTVASRERSFSKLKIIKKYLRSIIIQKKLVVSFANRKRHIRIN